MLAPLFSLVFLGTPDALAWNHTFRVWSRDDLPLRWYMSDYLEDSIPDGYQEEVIAQSYQNWIDAAPCAQLSFEYMGVRPGHHAQGRSIGDELNTFYFDDPLDEQGGGILGVTYTQTTGELAFARNGDNYYYAFDSDIVFSKNLDWAATVDIENGNCSSEHPLEGVATHEIGHQLGMAHSCEEEDVDAGNCTDEDLLNATMFWTSGGTCTLSQMKPNVDDTEGMTALYGPYATFEATTETRGGVPLEVCFSLTSNSAIEEAEWLFGDGDTSNELEPCHTYDVQGQYTINVIIRGNSDDCGEWEYTERERALVVTCEPPQAREGFDGLFSFEYLPEEDDVENGLVMVQMINQADTTVYGCIEQAQWDIFQGDTLIQSKEAWSPKLLLPADGSYRVVLNLGGPGGVTAEELTIETGEATGAGCSALGLGASLSGALLGLLAVGYRRRRA